MEEKKHTGRHRVIVDQREDLTIEGVNEVISFDEESVVCETNMGSMVIRGNDLHIEKLNLEQGLLVVVGEVDCVEYSDASIAKGASGLLGRIFK